MTSEVGSIVPELSPCDPHSPPTNPQTMDPSSSTSSHHSDSDWPIAIRKGTQSTCNSHPIYNFLSYHRLSLLYFSFVFSLSSLIVPSNIHEALGHPGFTIMPPPYCALRGSAKHCLFSKQWQHK